MSALDGFSAVHSCLDYCLNIFLGPVSYHRLHLLYRSEELCTFSLCSFADLADLMYHWCSYSTLIDHLLILY